MSNSFQGTNSNQIFEMKANNFLKHKSHKTSRWMILV